MLSTTSTLLTILTLALSTQAKTDLSGCTSSNTVAFGGASVLWYVPGTGEICSPLDCGGGRAPPKTTVPGCAAYSGTATYSPSYIAGYGIATASAKASSWASETIGSWTSEASALATESVKGGSTLSSIAVAATTAKATLSTAVAAGTGGITYDTSAVNGTALSTSATPTVSGAVASSSGSASGAGGVKFGREAMIMVVGAVVGVAFL
jgi:hypothetical protein